MFCVAEISVYLLICSVKAIKDRAYRYQKKFNDIDRIWDESLSLRPGVHIEVFV